MHVHMSPKRSFSHGPQTEDIHARQISERKYHSLSHIPLPPRGAEPDLGVSLHPLQGRVIAIGVSVAVGVSAGDDFSSGERSLDVSGTHCSDRPRLTSFSLFKVSTVISQSMQARQVSIISP
jgi:hypothetical protein